MKAYHQAPLPFVGQKRQFLQHYRSLLSKIPKDGNGWTIIDAFGGSGLLANNAKALLPEARVIYNDFDDYSDRLANIATTNQLRRQLVALLDGQERAKKLSASARDAVLDYLRAVDLPVDFRCISTWLLFSGQYANDFASLEKLTLYNRVRRSDYPSAEGYLTGIEIVKADFEALISEHLDNPQCLLVLDPPYVCTQQGMYANDQYFGMCEFLRLMRLVRPPFIFFSSTRSELIDYLDFAVSYQQNNWAAFRGYQRIAVKTSFNRTSTYQDNLVYKF